MKTEKITCTDRIIVALKDGSFEQREWNGNYSPSFVDAVGYDHLGFTPEGIPVVEERGIMPKIYGKKLKRNITYS